MKKLQWVLLPLALATSWTLAHRGPSHQTRLRRDLLETRQRFLDAAEGCNRNLHHQFTPGYKAVVEPGGMLWTQGEIFRTQNPMNVAINGLGCFGLGRAGETRYTRDGEFTIRDGVLCSVDGWDVLGYPLDSAGNRTSEPGSIRLAEDLFEVRFDERGCLYVGSRPVSQLALYSCPAANRFQPVSPTSYTSSAETAHGVAGEGALGAICPGSLELSNVDFMQQGYELQRTRRCLEPFASTSSLDLPLDPKLEQACLENLRHQLTPGYVPYDILGTLAGKGLHLRSGPGQLVETKNPFDFAVDGDGFMMLSGGNVTRSASFTWTRGALHCDGGDLLAVDSKGRLSPLQVPADALNLEVTDKGVVSWISLPGEGKPHVGARIAVTRIPDLEHCRREGAFFQDSGYHSTPDSVVVQGYLEYPRVDRYEMNLVGGSLMRAAGLPPCERERPIEPMKGASHSMQETAPTPSLSLQGSGMFAMPQQVR